MWEQRSKERKQHNDRGQRKGKEDMRRKWNKVVRKEERTAERTEGPRKRDHNRGKRHQRNKERKESRK